MKMYRFFLADLFCIFLIFPRSFFKGKVLGKSSISGWDGVPGHNGPLGTPGHNGPLGTHWGPHGPYMGPMLDPCWSNMVQYGCHVGPMLVQDGSGTTRIRGGKKRSMLAVLKLGIFL